MKHILQHILDYLGLLVNSANFKDVLGCVKKKKNLLSVFPSDVRVNLFIEQDVGLDRCMSRQMLLPGLNSSYHRLLRFVNVVIDIQVPPLNNITTVFIVIIWLSEPRCPVFYFLRQ